MKKVLIIEDDADTAQCINYLINDLGFKYERSDSILSTIDIIKSNPDIIILDYYLPNGHGSQLCLELKSNLLTKEIPVILMSTHPNLGDISKDCGADAYLEKPFDLNTLIQMVTKFTIPPLLIIAH
ncbi:response regulator [Mucilaginibacter gotjawali]|uniref:Phosphate regulon transcriptional regulatory protein PhoB n=2 Tax=Mucilaginibacter gotjawali TaxID=1550579 RepID=A0A120MYL8_9SPHI|nr:response regulator [Mucilaginibacter gotjawali]MBB3055511.1 DNA-binding response OmpR family regulator [Mucilaginibacter gotjawali]BAU53210.1 Phosphate regulon transcriptional regulatory protein PhoB [Mucilaginibacter gotjawali]